MSNIANFSTPSTLPALEISELVWNLKYRARSDAGEFLESTIDETFDRVARTLSAAEAEPDRWRERFRAAMRARQLLPGGRVLAGAGAPGERTLLNTFVMEQVTDDLESTLETLLVAASSMRWGGGIGVDFSRVSPCDSSKSSDTGPLAFMRLWDAMCRAILSSRVQRGAMMAVLSCEHPDIAEFVTTKRQSDELSTFNVSVLVTDAFMRHVSADEVWTLRFGNHKRPIRARELWDQIVQSCYDSGEPGVIFIDRVNRQNNLGYCERIIATNSCGEQPLPAYGGAPLASINLAALVKAPFQANAGIAVSDIEEIAALGVRLLDDVVSVTPYPDRRQQAEAYAKRRVGLGVTGVGDALIMCGVRYGEPAAIALLGSWLRTLQEASYRASSALARERGPFPVYDADAYQAAPTIEQLPRDLRRAIYDHGVRNAVVNSIAPAGSISLLADNVSSGIEPVFSHSCRRVVTLAGGEKVELPLQSLSVRAFRRQFGPEAPLTKAFVTAQDILPEAHIHMLAEAQRYVDASISKTVNCPPDVTFERFRDIYFQAYEAGCKSVAAYRPNAIRGAVLRPEPEPTPSGADLPEAHHQRESTNI